MKTIANGKAITFNIFKCRSCKSSIHIRTFWVTTTSFFICFFVWFGNTNLLPWISEDIEMNPQEITISKFLLTVSTIISRIIIGDLCDKIGARYCYILILICTIIPVCLLSFVTTSISYMFCNFFIGIIGSSFVITQYHTTQFFTDRLIGIANATSAGWGNFGGGVSAFVMPYIATNFNISWRYLTFISGSLLLIPITLYFKFTTDTVNGNVNGKEVWKRCNLFNSKPFINAIRDYRTWILFVVYWMCFGVEITVLTFMPNYLMFTFDLSAAGAGSYVFIFSALNLFARSCGGYGSDVLYRKYGIQGRVYTLFLVLLAESVFLFIFSFGDFSLGYSVVILLFFSFYVQCAEGITYAIVPFIGSGKKNKKIGAIYGIVAAGGNFGSAFFSLFIFLFTPNGRNMISYRIAFIIMAIFVFIGSFLTLLIKFTQQEIRTADELLMSFLQTHHATLSGGGIPSRTQSTTSTVTAGQTYSSPNVVIQAPKPPTTTNNNEEEGGVAASNGSGSTTSNIVEVISPEAVTPTATHNVSTIIISNPPCKIKIDQEKEKDTVELAHSSPGFVIH